jgi:hypothetical protein
MCGCQRVVGEWHGCVCVSGFVCLRLCASLSLLLVCVIVLRSDVCACLCVCVCVCVYVCVCVCVCVTYIRSCFGSSLRVVVLHRPKIVMMGRQWYWEPLIRRDAKFDEQPQEQQQQPQQHQPQEQHQQQQPLEQPQEHQHQQQQPLEQPLEQQQQQQPLEHAYTDEELIAMIE